MTSGVGTTMNTVRCDFCGLEFDPSCSEQSCNGCPISRNCTRIVCPRCGYQMLPEAKLVKMFKRLTLRLQERKV
jgi:hypothetical protein